MLLHPVYFLLRRLLMAVLVVFLRQWLFAQVIIMALSIIFACVLIGHIEAHTPQQRRFEFFNETVIMLVLYTMMSFTQFVPDPAARYQVGWLCILIVAVHLAINLGLILHSTVSRIKFDVMIWLAKRTLLKQRNEQK